MKNIFFGLMFLLTACGAPLDEDSYLRDAAYDSGEKVAIGQANPAAADEFTLAVSLASEASEVVFCKKSANDCDSASVILASKVKVAGGRHIYQSASYVRADSTAIFAVRYKVGTESKVFSYKFELPSDGSDSSKKGVWKMLFATGDNEFRAWDNAREKLVSMFKGLGVDAKNIKQLTMTQSQQTGDVAAMSKSNLQKALADMTAGGKVEEEHCLVFMTSHGSRSGFFLRGQGEISPDEFDGYLEQTCGKRKTVAIISACYSGIMINENSKRPHRIIMTAASKDVTSFGCDATSTYTYFDSCLIETLPKAQDWKSFSELNKKCVEDLEKSKNTSHHSNPQVWIGSEVQDLKIPAGLSLNLME